MDEAINKSGVRIFLIVWVTQSISVLGNAMSHFALIIWLTQSLYPLASQRQSLALALTTISLAKGVPAIFGAPLAGAWADRHDRKLTMIAANMISAVASLGMASMMAFDVLNLWLLLPLIIIASLSGSFHGAAFDASYATLVPRRFLPRANGLMQTMWSLSGMFAPMLAATIIGFFGGQDSGASGFLHGLSSGAAAAITIDAISFLFVGLILIFLNIPTPQRTDLYDAKGKRQKDIWHDIREGISYIVRRPAFLWLLGAFTVANFVVSTRSVFQPLIVKITLAPDWMNHGFTYETSLALLSTISSVGALIGGVGISVWGGLKNRRIYGVLIPMAVFALCQVVYGLSHSFVLTAVMTAGSALMIPILNAHSQSIWQSQTPKELQGRVFSVRRLIAQVTVPMGTLLAGLSSISSDPGIIMSVLGGAMAIFCLTQLFNSRLLTIENTLLDQPSQSAPTTGVKAA